ncbi:MAG: hypothetical protein BWY11_00240 [Firmicutes bacterium ADurb.Bin182]|nr:MAG: hypothetical protein BWY11_00240 [Firmicutes bacterium ADurb.Bin182]
MIRKCVAMLIALLAIIPLTACNDKLAQTVSPPNDVTETAGSVNLTDDINDDLPTMIADNNSQQAGTEIDDIKAASEVDFPDSMIYDLPENLSAGEFDEFLGMGGRGSSSEQGRNGLRMHRAASLRFRNL